MPCIDHFPPSRESKNDSDAIMLVQTLKFLTKEQIDKISNECSVPLHNFTLNKILCKICKYLTVDQIKSIKSDCFTDLRERYVSHLRDDYFGNATIEEKLIAVQELKRLGLQMEVCRDKKGKTKWTTYADYGHTPKESEDLEVITEDNLL